MGIAWYNPNEQSRGGRWISNQPGLKGKCVWLNWMIGGRRPTKADYGVITLQDNNGNTFKAYIEYIPRARITETQRNRRLRFIRVKVFVYGHRRTLNVPYPSSGRWFIFQIIFSKFCFQQR